MRIEITDQAVLLLDLTEDDRTHIEVMLRRTAGKSLVIPRAPDQRPGIPEEEQLEALIASMRISAQDTLRALRRRGYAVSRQLDD
jgi:hypothetical protein